ncbi:hypothetical protein N9359_02975 [Luminiphilus sp.]|nr:hypothetical protein [Luminiphilus sp.]
MPNRSQEDAQSHEGTDDAQRSEMTDDALEWRRVTFDLSNEVAFEKIVADRWDSEAGKPAELEDTLWRAHSRVETIERVRKEPYTFATPAKNIAATGHYKDTHILESSLQLSQLTLEEYKEETAKPYSGFGVDHFFSLKSLNVSIEEREVPRGTYVWRDGLDHDSAHFGPVGAFHMVVEVDNTTMRALLQSLEIQDHRITLTLQLRGRYKSENFYERSLFFWLQNDTGRRIYGDIELTNIRIGTHGGVSQQGWALPATSSISQAEAELAKWKKREKRKYRLEHLKKYWWAYLLGVALVRDLAFQLFEI